MEKQGARKEQATETGRVGEKQFLRASGKPVDHRHSSTHAGPALNAAASQLETYSCPYKHLIQPGSILLYHSSIISETSVI